MVVDTYKANHMQFHKPQSIVREDWVGRHMGTQGNSVMTHNVYLKAARRLGVPIKTKANFIIADTAKGTFMVVEVKKGVVEVGAKQIAPYLRMPVMARGSHILIPEPTEVSKPPKISYANQALVETLLGSHGRSALEKVLSLVKRSVAKLDWPLVEVEIRYVRDLEVKDWEYVLLMLVFTCDFDTADKHLYELYDQIDILIDKLSAEEQEVLRRMIFFDIKATVSIPSA